MKLPRYRIWAGLTLWLGLTVADLALVVALPAWGAKHGGPAGVLSLAGFVLAFGWARAGS